MALTMNRPVVGLEICVFDYKNMQEFLQEAKKMGDRRINERRALELMNAIAAFQGDYIWTNRIRTRKAKHRTDLDLTCRAVLPTDTIQIRKSYDELTIGLAATRALVLDYPHETSEEGRRIWFTKRPGRPEIYTKQIFSVNQESGKRTIVLY